MRKAIDAANDAPQPNEFPLSCSDLIHSGQLPNDVAKCLFSIARFAETTSIDIYLVGGMVRDLVARLPEISTSPDITVIGDAQEFAKGVAANISNCEIVSVSQHHTAKLKFDHLNIDVASARTDTYEPYGSLPKIILVDDIELDLGRRDFAINAMAMPIHANGFGGLIDPFQGRGDVNRGILRIIHKDSFREDPLRIMRGIRLAARYNHHFEAATASSISDAVVDLRRMVDQSPQRVFNEFRMWFAPHENLEAIVALAAATGLLRTLGIDASFPQNAFRHVSNTASDLARFAAFAYLMPPDTLSSLTNRLMMPTDWADTAKHTCSARSISERCRQEDISDVDLYRALIRLPDDVIQAAIAVENDNAVTSRLQDFQNRLRHVRTILNGDDLLALGVEQGPIIGKLLDELLALHIQGAISNADDERRHIINRLADD